MAGGGIDQARDRAARVGAQGDLRLERGGLDEGEQRSGVLGRAVVGRRVVLEDPSATEHALDAAHDVPLDAVELVGGQGGRGMEARPARRAADDVGAIQEEHASVSDLNGRPRVHAQLRRLFNQCQRFDERLLQLGPESDLHVMIGREREGALAAAA